MQFESVMRINRKWLRIEHFDSYSENIDQKMKNEIKSYLFLK